MKRLGRRVRRSDGSPEVNIAPLMDVVFILLIFFVVTTVFVEETGVEVERPSAAAARDLEKHSILIAVTREGRVVYGGQEYGLSSVRSLIARELSEEQMPVIILVDKTAYSGVLVDVIDECKLAGAKTVSIAARREEG
jgi:biopolymer transport protein ExbD